MFEMHHDKQCFGESAFVIRREAVRSNHVLSLLYTSPSNRLSNMNENILMNISLYFIILFITSISLAYELTTTNTRGHNKQTIFGGKAGC